MLDSVKNAENSLFLFVVPIVEKPAAQAILKMAVHHAVMRLQTPQNATLMQRKP